MPVSQRILTRVYHHYNVGWAMRVEAAAGSPLFRVTITCHLPGPLPLDSPQPVVALWMRQAMPAFHLTQGPDSIYGSAGIPRGYGFRPHRQRGVAVVGTWPAITGYVRLRPDGYQARSERTGQRARNTQRMCRRAA